MSYAWRLLILCFLQTARGWATAAPSGGSKLRGSVGSPSLGKGRLLGMGRSLGMGRVLGMGRALCMGSALRMGRAVGMVRAML